MEWFYLFLEIILITAFAILGVYFIWIIKGKQQNFGVLLQKYGYAIGILLLIIFSLITVCFF